MKFVIHHHTINNNQKEKNHYDLMIEVDDSLLTWRIAEDDLLRLVNEETINAEIIQTHRKEYLSYQGPISCNRGMVHSYDSGKYDRETWSDEKKIISVNGNKFKGRLTIKKKKKNQFLIYFSKN